MATPLEQSSAAQQIVSYQDRHDPDRLATEIQDAAIRDLQGDQGAKLEVRQKLEELKREAPAVRVEVLRQLAEEGSHYNPFNPIPQATIRYATDVNGNEIKTQPVEIVFSSAWSNDGRDVVAVNKTLADQAAEAENRYYTQTVPNAGLGVATAIALREHDKQSGTLSEERKLWWERVQQR